MIGPVIPSLICLVTQVDQGPGSSQGQTETIYSNSSKVHILTIIAMAHPNHFLD